MGKNKRDDRLLVSVIILTGLLLCISPTVSLAAGSKPNSYYTKPDLIMAEVSRRGSGVIVSELFDCQEKWNFVLRQIATGEKSWLRVSIALHPGSDAAASEMLNFSVGEAIEKQPENVFRIALPEFQLELICSGPDVDDVRFDSYELSLQAIERRQKRLLTISDANLKKISRDCMKLLEDSKSRVAEFYGVSKHR